MDLSIKASELKFIIKWWKVSILILMDLSIKVTLTVGEIKDALEFQSLF